MMGRGWMGVAIAWVVIAPVVSGCSEKETEASTGAGGTTGSGGQGGGTTSAGGGGATGGTTSAGGTTSTGGGSTGDPCAGEITGFVPEWKPSTGLHQGLCDDAQTEAFFDACIFAGGSSADCTAVTEAAPACAQCLLSDEGAPAFGPMTLYQNQSLIYENPGQCISEIEGDATSASCGAKVYAALACGIAACSSCIGVAFSVLLDCFAAAKEGDCSSFYAEGDACVADLKTQGLPIEPCIDDGSNFNAYLLALGKLGCGP